MAAQDAPLYHEPFRPQYHYSPPCYWMNDPNGLVYDAGEYHLFYQYHPESLVWGPMHWGHAVSTDLVHWETLPIALYPDEHGTIFSGSAVIDVNNTAGFGKNAMVAIYSYNTQTQGLAYSTDHGRTWAKYTGNPVLPAMAKDFRDPKVFWYEATKQWIMVISMGHEVQFFTSPNLREWKNSGRFTGGHMQAVWEVPDLFPLELEGQTKWVLLVSMGSFAPAGGSGIQYFTGDFNGQTFIADNAAVSHWLDYGPDNYAGTTWSDVPGNKRLYIGWLNNWTYAEHIPTLPWRGATTLPRELSLIHTADGIRLAQTPVTALTTLRRPLGTWNNLEVSHELSLEGVQGRTLEIIADFEATNATRFGIDVQRNAAERTRVVYNSAQAQLLISRMAPDSTLSSFTPTFGAPLHFENNQLRLHIFVDESSVEVFANQGEIALTSQTFVDQSHKDVVFFAEGSPVKISHLEVYAMDSIWSKVNATSPGTTQCEKK